MQISKIVSLFVKKGKSIPIHKTLTKVDDFACEYVDDVLGAVKGKGIKGVKLRPTLETQAKLGDASVWIESRLQGALPEAKSEMSLIFGDLQSVERTMHRSKGALSIYPKLEKGLVKAAESSRGLESMDDAVALIGDGIGSRVITKALPKSSKSELDDMIAKTIIDGRKITPDEIKLLKGYIYSGNPGKSSDKVFRLYEQFAQPLVEKRSKEVVDRLTASVLKHRVNTEGLDVSSLRAKGLFDDDILKLVEAEEVLPLEITQINNYRGAHGLAEFTNGQIQQLSRALNTGRSGPKIKIASDVRGLDDFLYPPEEVATLAKKSIKSSGYRTAQMNVVHANGALGEIQFRGPQTNIFGEYEHIAYDLRQGKNTLGPLFDDFTASVSKLTDKQYQKYNKYLEECYNYYHRLELGLPGKKPKLPRGFDKVLSEESMRALHDKAELLAKEQGKTFSRHLAEVA